MARKRGRPHVTADELNTMLPPEELSADEIEDFMTMLAEHGIVVVEG